MFDMEPGSAGFYVPESDYIGVFKSKNAARGEWARQNGIRIGYEKRNGRNQNRK